MSTILHTELEAIRSKAKGIIGLCSGVFDLTHAGHALFLEECKNKVDILVVAVASDKVASFRKGPDRPVQNEIIRLKTIDAFRYVDYCFIDTLSNEQDLLAMLPIAFTLLKPDLYIINNDAFEIPRRQKLAGQFGVQMIVQERTCPPDLSNISTTAIIQKIRNTG